MKGVVFKGNGAVGMHRSVEIWYEGCAGCEGCKRGDDDAQIGDLIGADNGKRSGESSGCAEHDEERAPSGCVGLRRRNGTARRCCRLSAVVRLVRFLWSDASGRKA